MLMSLLSSVGLTSAFISEGPGFEFARRYLFSIEWVSTAIHSVMNAIGLNRFIVGENSGYANTHVCIKQIVQNQINHRYPQEGTENKS
jgi:hypothetical protein